MPIIKFTHKQTGWCISSPLDCDAPIARCICPNLPQPEPTSERNALGINVDIAFDIESGMRTARLAKKLVPLSHQ